MLCTSLIPLLPVVITSLPTASLIPSQHLWDASVGSACVASASGVSLAGFGCSVDGATTCVSEGSITARLNATASKSASPTAKAGINCDLFMDLLSSSLL